MRSSTNYVLYGLLSTALLFVPITGCVSLDKKSGSDSSGNDSLFVLPYPVGQRYSVIQGNSGRWGHTDAAQYAYDFKMDIGTPIVAAKGGRVIAVEERYEDGNRTPGQENFIFIQHDDSTFSRYYHLSKDGVLVEESEQVKKGQQIGLSGNTGASAGPHLHFDVTASCPEWGCQTISIVFANASGNPLREGEMYEALDY